MKLSRAQILAVVRRWQARLLLDRWEITVRCTTKMAWPGECLANPAYLEAWIRFNPTLLTPETLEATVVHELPHCHTWGMWEIVDDASRGDPAREKAAEAAHEALTSILQRVVMR